MNSNLLNHIKNKVTPRQLSFSLHKRNPLEVMAWIAISVLLLLVGSLVAEKPVSFQNFQVFSVNVTNEHQLEGLGHLEESALEGIEFWKSASGIGRRADIMVSPHQLATFENVLQNLELQSQVMVVDV